MGYSRNALNAYKETRVRTAGRGQLIVMLYDEALRQLDTAIELLQTDAQRYDAVNTALTKAKDCITELMVSVDFEQGGEIAKNLFGLYSYFSQQILEANIKKDESLLFPLRRHLGTLRDAWEQAARTAQGGEGSSGVHIAG